MIIRALQWRLCNIEAAKELAHRKKVKDIKDTRDIMSRAWF